MENKTPKPLIDILAQIGKNQRWLAMQCQVNDSTVTRWVTGAVVPNAMSRAYIEGVLDHPVEWVAK